MADTSAAPPPSEDEAREDLRHRRAEASRSAIRDAATEILRSEHPSAISIPAVAKQAGVSVRTVYRYFPSKQDLLDDVAGIQMRRADAIMEGRRDMFEKPDQYLMALWSDFEQDVDAIRAQHLSPAGADLRRRRGTAMRAELQVRLDKAFPETDDQDRDDLGDLIMLVTSSAAFLELHSRLGHSGADAARLAWWATKAMQRQFDADGGIK